MIGTRRITRRSFLAAAGLAAVGASLSLTGCSGSVSDGLSSKHLLVAHSHSEAHQSTLDCRDDGSCFC